MVYFNDTEIEIYELDSVETIIKRLSVSEKTLPKYIYFPDDTVTMELISTKKKITFINCIDVFENEKNFEDVYEKLKDNFSFKELVATYIIFNVTFNNLCTLVQKDPELLQHIFYDFLEKLNKINMEESINIGYINTIWNSKYSQSKLYKEDVIKNEKNTINITKSFENFKKIIGNKYTKFEKQKIKFQIELDIKDTSLLELFNNIKLNKNAPFATTKYFYKILKDVKPFERWSNLFERSKTYFDKYKNIDRDHNIILKILQNNSEENLLSDYTEAIINMDKNINIKMSYNIKNVNIKDTELIKRVLDTINIDTFNNRKDINVNGVFYFPNQKVNKYLISDVIMNDPLFSNLLTIDETTIGSRDNVYIHFHNTIIENLTCYITTQQVKKDKIPVPKEYKNLFPNNSYYLRIKIRNCETIEKVEYFQNILSKLLVLYNDQEKKLIEFYKKYNIKLVDDITEEEIIDDKKLKNIESEIFRPNYSSKCPNPPTYVNDEEAEEAEKAGKQVIIFPKELTHGVEPKKYICSGKKKYPGLRSNPFDNSDKFPFIPCCYGTSQINKVGSKYRNYYFGEKLEEKEKKTGAIYVSDMIIPPDSYGILPENINKILGLNDFDSIYYRKGVFRNTNSFISCVLESLDAFDNKIKSEREQIKEIIRIRKSLISPELIASCKQEMYDYKNEDIRELILNEEKYFDPKLFIHLLEVKFKCNIFLFHKDDDGSLILPRYIKGYYKTEKNATCIFIYEHSGGESDDVEYPQCELIIRQNIDEDEKEKNFEYGSTISQNIFKFFEKINTSYIFNKKITFTKFNLQHKKIKILSQFIDAYGKTRIINIKYMKRDISIITSPIQPIEIEEEELINIHKIDTNIMTEFMAEIGGKITHQIMNEDNIVKEVHGKIGNVDIIIPMNDENKIIDVPFSIISAKISDINFGLNKINVLSYPENNISVINNYNKYKKLSRYISEYLLWMYSVYISENSLDENEFLSTENLKKFKDEYIEIIENFEYSNVPKIFSYVNGLFFNKKLVVKSEETLKRLFYVLLWNIKRNFKKFIDYKDRKTIENYYVDITDFDIYPFQVILEGENSVIKWVNEKNNENAILYQKIIVSSTPIQIPYFFRNKLVENNKIFLAQNTDSVLKAINLSIIWKTKGYNCGNNVNIINKNIPELILYSYINEKNITKYNILGETNIYDIKIIGYKIENIPMYTVLMEVN